MILEFCSWQRQNHKPRPLDLPSGPPRFILSWPSGYLKELKQSGLETDHLLQSIGEIKTPHVFVTLLHKTNSFFSFGATPPHWARASSFTTFLDHTQRRTTVGRTPLKEGSARRRDLYLTTHSIYNRQTSMSPVRFEPTISEGERPQTHALDRATIVKIARFLENG